MVDDLVSAGRARCSSPSAVQGVVWSAQCHHGPHVCAHSNAHDPDECGQHTKTGKFCLCYISLFQYMSSSQSCLVCPGVNLMDVGSANVQCHDSPVQAAAIGAFPYRSPVQQETQDMAAAMASQINNARGSAQQQQQQQQQQQLPQLPPELLQGLSGIISGLDSSIAAKAASTLQNASTSGSSASVPAPSSTAATPSGSLGTAGMPAGASSPLLGGSSTDGSGDPRGTAAVIGGTRNGGGGNGGGPGGSNLGDPRQEPGGPGGSQPAGSGGTQPGVSGSMGGSQPVGGANGRRRLLATGMETVQRRANVVFLGLLGLTLADLLLLVLFGIQHPHSKERSPRLYISSAPDQQPPAQYKDGAVEGVTLQVRSV